LVIVKNETNSFNRLEVDIAEVTYKSNLLGMKSSFPNGSAHEILMQYTIVIVNVSFSVYFDNPD
jgi:hypothetical protein